MRTTGFIAVMVLLLLLAGVCPLEAASRTWVPATGTNDWFDRFQWSPNDDYPRGGDTVTIATAGAVLLTNSTEYLSSLDLSKTLIFSNWNTTLSATNITIQSGGTVTVASAFTTNAGVMSNNVWIACSNLFLASGGKINVDTKGYVGGASSANGQGPQYGQGGTYGAGGGYGGFAWDSAQLKGGKTYGAPDAPLDPGSGGGGGNTGPGGTGGGAVRIQASGVVTINGTITANGGTGTHSGGGGGGGSGGSIYLSCFALDGTNGVLSADGGWGWYEGGVVSSSGGGGGRIAICYNPGAQVNVPLVKFSARPGWSDYNALMIPTADPGTLYFPNTNLLVETIVHSGQIIIPGFTNWSPATLLVSNGWVRFPVEGFRLNVAGDLRVTGTNGSLGIGGSQFNFITATILYTPIVSGMTSPPLLQVGGNLVLTNGGSLYVYAAATNVGAPSTNYGALVAVTGAVFVGSNSYVSLQSHPTNGGSVWMNMSSLTVAAGGRIEADGRGFAGGTNYANGFGPGASVYSSYPPGAGYGGPGGESYTLPYASGRGPTYGSASAPLDPGSGGAGNNSSRGGHGGGLVRIVASGTVLVDGTISADGVSGVGGGAGGAIYVTCNVITGQTGVLRVTGGAGGQQHYGAGGGGRIALDYNLTAQTFPPGVRCLAAPGFMIVPPNMVPYPHRGEPGTLWFPNGVFMTETMSHQGEIVIPGLTNWAVNNLTVSNGWIRFSQDGFALTVSNALTVTGTNAALEIGGSTHFTNLFHRTLYTDPELIYGCRYARCGMNTAAVLRVGGNLVLTNKGALVIYSAATNAGPPAYGALLSVAGDMAIATNSVFRPYSHPTNGGSVFVQVKNLTVARGARIDVFDGGFGGIQATGRGYGTGAGNSDGHSSCGGGYGGAGGRSYNLPTGGGITYGSSNAPVDPGSSGGRGANGGGLVSINADNRIVLDGTITANAGGTGVGGGSGGGIYLRCKTWMGSASGVLTAKGGNANDTWSGSGGGGRIAVWRTRDRSTGAVSNNVDPGVPGGSGGYTGFVGTIVWGMLPESGTVFVVH